jgi:Tol biopolymer transport system component
MSLSPGSRVGSYEVLSVLGAGGMGEVYRARDLKLGRDVALKVLPDLFAGDADRLARFEREAQVLASLNHSNIAQIYGVEDSGNVRALVMELVEGPTLADRIAAGPLPLDEAMAIAKQIVHALESAHQVGIIHRDLKPANIKVRPDGTVKVLDFGLAKALEPIGSARASVSMSPTLSIHATHAGLILGTAAYMAPEQARGKPVDTRADIWAFGVVLFEMLTGRRPFDPLTSTGSSRASSSGDGDSVSDTLASILKSEPTWSLLPNDTPPPVQRLLRRCLAKDREQRLQHIGDARLEIDDALRPISADSVPRREIGRGQSPWMWIAAVLLVAAVIAAIFALRTTRAPAPPELYVDITTPVTTGAASFAMAPDGRSIVFSGRGTAGTQLWLRSLETPATRPLPGTQGGEWPFWSPDSRSIGFFAGNKLKRLDIDAGDSQGLANVLTPAGGTWNQDGVILYVANDSAGVLQISAAGGEPRRATAGDLATRLPQFLPDGKHFLFYVASGTVPAGVYVGELGNQDVRRIMAADGPAIFASGHLLFVRERNLLAQRFDPSTQQPSGPLVSVAEDVPVTLFAAAVSASAAGHIAYRAGSPESRRQLVWFDRSGKQGVAVGDVGQLMSNPTLSPDGRHVVVQRTVQGNIDLWSIDLERNVSSRLTVNPEIDSLPVWSPDGSRILFNTTGREDRAGFVIMRIDGAAPLEPVRVASGTGAKIATDWSSDGRFLLYKQFDQTTSTDLWALPMQGDQPPMPVVQTPYAERDGQFSPDVKSVAYESDESGQPNIYLQPFPGPGTKVRVSPDGGTQVRWRRDGKELFYIAADQSLMAVPIGVTAGAAKLGIPVRLFQIRTAPVRSISRQQYVVSADGQRFLIITAGDAPLSPITLVLNWRPGREGDSEARRVQ